MLYLIGGAENCSLGDNGEVLPSLLVVMGTAFSTAGG